MGQMQALWHADGKWPAQDLRRAVSWARAGAYDSITCDLKQARNISRRDSKNFVFIQIKI